jgi:hypothetical protein
MRAEITSPRRLASDLGVMVWDVIAGTEPADSQALLKAAKDYLAAIKHVELTPLLTAARALAYAVKDYYGPSGFIGSIPLGRNRGPTAENWQKLTAGSRAYEQKRIK